jgi:hypothetical protein
VPLAQNGVRHDEEMKFSPNLAPGQPAPEINSSRVEQGN